MASRAFQRYIDSFTNYELSPTAVPESAFKLQRLEALLDFLGKPHQKLKCLHIAGTKGKGSTCAFTAHILKKAGYRVGLYTSPHLSSLNERIRLLTNDRVPAAAEGVFPDCITDPELDRLTEEIKSGLEKFRQTEALGRLTYFEVLTALAFCYFFQSSTDLVVLETGLGGRLDATNVVKPLVCAVTSISLDHTQQLGKDLASVAAEKAAIIKKDKPVVIAPQPKEVMDVIDQRCREVRARPVYVGRDITWTSSGHEPREQIFTVQGLRQTYHLRTGMIGMHQIINAAVAVGLSEIISEAGFSVGPEAVVSGSAEAFWPARMEIVGRGPQVVLDAAHNPESIKMLTANMKIYFPGRKIILVLGISRDKDIPGICRQIAEAADQVIFARAVHPRAYDFSDPQIRAVFGEKASADVNAIGEALKTALMKAREDDVILITGSIFLVAQAREILIRKSQTTHVMRHTQHPSP